MARLGWTWVAVAASLAVVGGCASHRREQRAASTQAGAASSQAQRTAAQAAQTEQQLAQARQRLEVAHRNAVAADNRLAQSRQQLTTAEQGAAQAHDAISREQANVQRLDVAARDQRALAEQAAMDAQVASEQAQGLRSAAGRIVDASPTRVLIQVEGGQTMAFDIDPSTRVLVGTEQRSVSELQQGADARVAYDARRGEPTAVAIHVAPARGRPVQPAPQAQPQR